MFTAIYIVAAVVGLGLVVGGALGGHHGHDGEIGHHDGVDHHGDSDHGIVGPWIPFFSLRFWTYFAAATGAVGLLLQTLTKTPELTTFGLSLAAGAIAGTLAFLTMRLIRTHESDSMTREADLMGRIAKVLVAIRGGELGRIRLENKGEILDLLAKSPTGATIEAGAEVVILDVDGSTMLVAPSNEIFETQETNA